MRIKCVAIGNRIMGDDSVGIKVLEELSTELENKNVEVIFGETDNDYALSKIKDGDYLFILDATYFNIVPGTVTFTPINSQHIKCQQVFSQHQPSLINLLNIYKKSVKGYIIGIEVKEIDFSLDISETLKKKFSNICQEISIFINNTLSLLEIND